ncbi:MAG: 4-demethylwyosine synthase TYW1 [Thermoplasmata archaeon]|nr:MAG: 4-demethylwyosine synthase TYW1 [Thermoplasmata archaeon]
MNEQLRKILQKQRYQIVGNHSGVKLCHWMRQKLLHNRPCYKERFYGISTHRCLQMTPTVDQCNQECLFCWRYHGEHELDRKAIDGPERILEEAIAAQRTLLTGFKGDDRCDINYWQEGQTPTQVAISLAGEPTIYPHLSDFMELCHGSGMTTFLVTNGTLPKALERLDTLPTQLYVTVAAPTEEVYRKLCLPHSSIAGWKNLKRTLELLPSLSTRTVIRHTLVEEWNLGNVEDYAKLDALAEPMFIEPKGYMFVGHSRQILSMRNMPKHDTINEFGSKLAELLGYEILDELPDSRVVLLGKDKSNMIIKS